MKVLLRAGFIVLALMLVALLMLAACGEEEETTTTTSTTTTITTTQTTTTTTPAGGPQYGGVLIVVHDVGPKGPFGWPAESLAGAGGFTISPVFDRLVRYDLEGNVIPMLATDWEFAPDYKSITLTLRKGVKFHDGTDFNAEAVKFNLDAQIAAKRSQTMLWSSVDVIDDYTVRITLERFQNTMPGSDLKAFSMASPTAFETKGLEWVRYNPVGTGPFKFVSFDRDVSLKMERNDDYWQEGKPYLDGIEYLFIADPMTQSLAMQTGAFHVLRVISIEELVELQALGFEGSIDPYGCTSALIPDSGNPGSKFADKRVRQAMSYAIDSGAIAEALGYGVWTASYQLPNAGTPAFIPDLEGLREYNPDKARQLLADAGYPKGFKTKIMPHLVIKRDAAVALQQYLGEVGIVVNLDFMEPGSYFQLERDGWRDGLLLKPLAGVGVQDFARAVKAYFTGATGLPSCMKPAGFEDLIAEALETPDPETQKALYQELNRLTFDEAMVIPAWWESLGYVYAEGVHDTGFDTLSEWMEWHPENAWLERNAWIE